MKNSDLETGEFYPNFYNSNPNTLELLKLLVGEIRPAIVIETGIANGISTKAILQAFQEYSLHQSKLFSFDVDIRVATPVLLSNPQFSFIPVTSPRSFRESVNSISTVDLFYHDSDHSYSNQLMEYLAIWEILNTEKGVLVSDDINWSNAFLDFCKKVNRTPLLLSDGGKFCGVITR